MLGIMKIEISEKALLNKTVNSIAREISKNKNLIRQRCINVPAEKR